MNQIRVKRLLWAGFATLIVWIAVSLLVEQVIGRMVFGRLIENQWLQRTTVSDWTGANHAVNIFLALLNATLLVWLYASLRPMYGVGAKTALITSVLGALWGFSMAINFINLGLFPTQAGLVEAVFEAIEMPIAMLAGASVYEGGEDSPPDEEPA